MCGPTTLVVGSIDDEKMDGKTVIIQKESGLMKIVMAMGAIFVVVFVALLVAILALAFNMSSSGSSTPQYLQATGSTPTSGDVNIRITENDHGSAATADSIVSVLATQKPPTGPNPCAGKKPDVPNAECVVDAIVTVGPQSGSNVTAGYTGTNDDGSVPITVPYYEAGLCPVNVHWHLGAEHLSVGEYDENGSGPALSDERRRLAGDTSLGFQCTKYDPSDTKFTTPYEWEHCVDMVVGQTYEVHWPHSAAGACGTINQYQTPFYDGVFCRDGILTDTAAQIGVQAQVFIIVNDESYYYPDLMRGMIVDGGMGSDIAKYTGSTTGTSRDNEICSQYSPITWQVDRKCHMVSASTFDKMCADMKAQRDDMTDDLYAHGSRDLVADHLAADNHQRKLVRGPN
eukprot:CAMPEP_0202443348 /NCGR_PEP_ID=MMETSP1360-20130828/2649_1 /ASSEMBLY_ACC=CAM_ASM_000848 /TAXON_ID=515479 /ORGANISM="Licmophora paradoxa, Strain CCMP2313" /LENGTH=399 /DNA_ID=CAMNT_0049059021 /DNA_START=28 /DNA_END=1227 /DNA_ORIENTATION=+